MSLKLSDKGASNGGLNLEAAERIIGITLGKIIAPELSLDDVLTNLDGAQWVKLGERDVYLAVRNVGMERKERDVPVPYGFFLASNALKVFRRPNSDALIREVSSSRKLLTELAGDYISSFDDPRINELYRKVSSEYTATQQPLPLRESVVSPVSDPLLGII